MRRSAGGARLRQLGAADEAGPSLRSEDKRGGHWLILIRRIFTGAGICCNDRQVVTRVPLRPHAAHPHAARAPIPVAQVEIALDFARGMAYLHSRRQPIVHRDLVRAEGRRAGAGGGEKQACRGSGALGGAGRNGTLQRLRAYASRGRGAGVVARGWLRDVGLAGGEEGGWSQSVYTYGETWHRHAPRHARNAPPVTTSSCTWCLCVPVCGRECRSPPT